MHFELISFKLCPFVQRSIIVLNHKNVEHTITHINLDEPPAWFKKISPLGKVPILKVDNEILFESAVINEYINEVTPGSLLAEEPLAKARQRAWIEFSSTLNMDLFELTGSADKDAFDKNLNLIRGKLDLVADEVGGNKWFTGDGLSLTDSAFAPFFMRTKILANFTDDITAHSSKLEKWVNNLMDLDEVKSSVVPEFDKLFIKMTRKRSTYLKNI